MARADEVNPNPSSFRLLSDSQFEQIHLASLEILRRTGVRVYDAEALELLAAAGWRGDRRRPRQDSRPRSSRRPCSTAPSRIVLCSRTGEPAMYLEAHRSYFGTGSDLPNTLDLETGERRPSLLTDVGADGPSGRFPAQCRVRHVDGPGFGRSRRHLRP